MSITSSLLSVRSQATETPGIPEKLRVFVLESCLAFLRRSRTPRLERETVTKECEVNHAGHARICLDEFPTLADGEQERTHKGARVGEGCRNKKLMRIVSSCIWSSVSKSWHDSKISSCLGAILSTATALRRLYMSATQPMTVTTNKVQQSTARSKRKCNITPTPPCGMSSVQRFVCNGYNM
eukprot:CAMPEP_0115196610 /NCGR_PEP_ID=MMETSP0270-20121206/15174_1 /TAXON_ID=71861 /ORGANISM="Scrippsiella trochoidea, Strain CCMP3099" /LENGTH=181 /DNA_ID=CAMNT_0002609947 /DNA_START=62 /DNA_END=608 /DNA_ORIENTATION=+